MIANFNYIISLMIFIIGLYAMITSNNLLKKLLAMSIFQSAILLFFISMAKVHGAKIPILKCLDYSKCPEVYTNPLPHVLMLTAIVVGLATLSVGLAIIVRIKENLSSIDENEIAKIENS